MKKRYLALWVAIANPVTLIWPVSYFGTKILSDNWHDQWWVFPLFFTGITLAALLTVTCVMAAVVLVLRLFEDKP